jgi:hypothetical protein
MAIFVNFTYFEMLQNKMTKLVLIIHILVKRMIVLRGEDQGNLGIIFHCYLEHGFLHN